MIIKNEKLAILQDLTNNKTLFLKEGEHYKSLLVKSIDVEKVTYLENKEEKVIKLKR